MRAASAFPDTRPKTSTKRAETAARIRAQHRSRGSVSMAPVNTSASATDVDNEITAELPVLDVAAYEATLDTASHTDSWAITADTSAQAASDVTMQMPKPAAATPTLRVADDTGTHEMPVFKKARAPQRDPAPTPVAPATAPAPHAAPSPT